MTDQALGKRYSNFINVLLFVFPIFITSTKVAGDLILFILAICGLVIAISQKISPFKIPGLRLFSWITLFYFTMVCLSVLFSGKASELAHYIPRELHFIFAPLIGLAIYKAKINLKHFMLGIKIALVILGIIALIQYNDGHPRPSGVMNANIYGPLATTLLLVSLIGFFQKGSALRAFSIFAFAMGLTAIVLSGARGAWVTLVIGSLAYIILIFKQGLVNNNKIMVALLITTLVGILATNDGIHARISLAYSQYNQWTSGAVDSSKTSVGTRLEMYRAGLKAVPDTPLFGHGYRQANVVASHYASKESQKHIASYNHLHNTYLSMFLYSGIFGLLSLLLLFFAPLRLFIKNIGNRNLTYEVNMGIMLILSMAASGLTSVTFGDANMNGLYILFLAYLLPVIIKKSAS